MKSLYSGLHKAIRGLLFVILTLMVIIVTVQILVRYVFFYSLSWSEELSRYLFAWLILIGACLGIEDRSSICIDVIENLTHGNAKKIIHILQYVFSLIAVGIMFYASIKFVQLGARQLSPAMAIPMAVIYMCFPIGFVLMGLENVIKLVQIFRYGDVLTEEAKGGEQQ